MWTDSSKANEKSGADQRLECDAKPVSFVVASVIVNASPILPSTEATVAPNVYDLQCASVD